MTKKFLMGLTIFIVIFLGYAAMQPSQYSVKREIKISATPEIVFANVNDLRKFQEWNPWAKLDPNAKMTFGGPDHGTGSFYTWEGNSDVGTGKMTIIESIAPAIVRAHLEYLKPFEAKSTAEFSFRSEGETTIASWSHTGDNNFMSKIICIFMDMDKMIGGMFEKGLTNLKTISENQTKN